MDIKAMQDRKLQLWVGCAAITALTAVISLVLFGMAGAGRRGAEAFYDVRYWYLSTRLWLAGGNPYDHTEFSLQAARAGINHVDHFAYPPTSFWIGLPLQVLPTSTSAWIWMIVNVIALAAIAFGCIRMLRALRPNLRWDLKGSTIQLIVIAIVFGTPFTMHVVWIGQTTLLVTALLMWSWIFIYSGSAWVGGVLFALGAIKPQLALFLGIWLLVDGRWRAAFSAALTSLLLALVPFLASGTPAITGWIRSMATYLDDPPQAALTGNLNLQSLIAGVGIAEKGSAVTASVLLAGALSYFLFWRANRRYKFPWVVPFAVLVPMSLLFLYGRYYDLAACVGLVVLGAHLSDGNPRRQAIMLVSLFVICIPQRLWFTMDVHWLHYWRQVVLSVVISIEMVWTLRMYSRTKTEGTDIEGPTPRFRHGV